MSHKIMFCAGEASGDMHAAELVKAIKQLDPQTACIGFGGSKMAKAGVCLAADMADYSVMGFYEVLLNLRKMFALKRQLVELMRAEKPDALVLVDYPDFNWRLAPAAKELGIPIFSYIPPSAWAWRKGRAVKVAQLADCIAAIFPFELEVYRQAGANIHFVGNPLLDTVHATMKRQTARAFFKMASGQKNILLLPGSRKQEIAILLSPMLAAAAILQQSDCVFHLLLAPDTDRTAIEAKIAASGVKVQLHTDNAYDLMQACDVAIATSGTVVLEAALLGLPSVVLYKMAQFTYWIAKLFVHIDYFSLPNILTKREVVPELLQGQVSAANIAASVERLATKDYKERFSKDLLDIRHCLGEPGVACRTASLVFSMLRSEEWKGK